MIACAVLIAVVIVGFPDTHEDAPLTLQSVTTTIEAPVTTVAAAPTQTTTAPPSLGRAPANVHVIAFNGSTVPGSAGKMSTKLKGQGYAVTPAGPDRKTPQDGSEVLYRPGFDAEARALATALGLDASVAKPADAATGGWGSAEVAVVVGNELARRI